MFHWDSDIDIEHRSETFSVLPGRKIDLKDVCVGIVLVVLLLEIICLH
jgi:hypothetical protein